jgi:hypothetical protein
MHKTSLSSPIPFKGTYNIKVKGDPVPKNAISNPSYTIETTHQNFMAFHNGMKGAVEADGDKFVITPEYHSQDSEVICSLKYAEPDNPKMKGLGEMIKNLVATAETTIKLGDAEEALNTAKLWITEAKGSFDKQIDKIKPRAVLVNEICTLLQNEACLDFRAYKSMGSDTTKLLPTEKGMTLFAQKLLENKNPVISNSKLTEIRDSLKDLISLHKELKAKNIIDEEYKDFNVALTMDQSRYSSDFRLMIVRPKALGEAMAEQIGLEPKQMENLSLIINSRIIAPARQALAELEQ